MNKRLSQIVVQNFKNFAHSFNHFLWDWSEILVGVDVRRTYTLIDIESAEFGQKTRAGSTMHIYDKSLNEPEKFRGDLCEIKR